MTKQDRKGSTGTRRAQAEKKGKRSDRDFYLGIDIGGTFTDLCLLDGQGKVSTFKTASTPEDLLRGVLSGISLVAESVDIPPMDLLGKTVYLGHGTTIATNALLQRRGSKVGLITTRGFKDTILIQRSLGMTAGLTEEELADYSLRGYPEPIVPKHLIREVSERIDYKGSVVIELNRLEAEQAIEELRHAGVDVIAVCFLWSFLNPIHERKIQKMAEKLGLYVTTSSELFPVLGEYERTASTVLNAYLAPNVRTYFQSLGNSLKQSGLKTFPLIMHSEGGVISPEEASENALSLLMSGPAGGVIGSQALGKVLRHSQIITTDMGGTSFDVGLIVGGEPVKAESAVYDKYHTLVPAIAIETIGAGGGSIARVVDGNLSVGPDSAGAVPGPVCYNKGGEEPTVTDADVVLGIINPSFFLGGRIPLDLQKAHHAIEERIAKPLGISVLKAAAGIRQIIDQRMADLIRRVTLERGYDPQDFVLYAYGGAGPTHCASFGKELRLSQIVIPQTAGSHSAFGAVTSDARSSFIHSHLMRTPPLCDNPADQLDAKEMEGVFRTLEEKGANTLVRSGVAKRNIHFDRYLHMRYRRQTHEVPVPITNGSLSHRKLEDIVKRFEDEYEFRYGQGSQYREAGLEITHFRVEAIGQKVKPKLRALRKSSARRETPDSRDVYFYEVGRKLRTKFYRGTGLIPGQKIIGPAVLEYVGTTVLIEPGQRAFIDPYLNIRIEP